MNELSSLPSIEQLLQTRTAAELIAAFGRPLTLDAIRSVLSNIRSNYQEQGTIPLRGAILELAHEQLKDWASLTLLPIINATGVVLHTNLGRAPLSKAALQAIASVSGSYSTLEYDLDRGNRGSRSVHAEALIKRITGAEAGFVVNNNAGAILLILSALARHKKVIISRTQLVEIGDGFRIPEVMRQSGAKLVEVGATNRVNLVDYKEALQNQAALVLHAHQSNFKIIGFTSEPPISEIILMAHAHKTWFVDDLGSGALLDTARFGLSHEPSIQESLAAGADLVCFSGDKLVGGPQAGILAGRADLIAKIKRHPIARTVRADKLCLAALSATLMHYLKDEAEREIPIWQMIAKTPREIEIHARHWQENLGVGEIIPGFSTVGGGSLPGDTLSTYLLALKVQQPNRFLKRLRLANPPIIARVQDDRVVLDPRTLLPDQDGAFLVGVKNALKGIA
ncbi:MAG: L-seryl-tRNA(Sec) selenium transferase [Anaerolineaceae bacterium]|nr:L-seryl-tRNA(Sec) selenium transferase [Anaerolineaceae bacterium]